jgi:hypothetical protein
MGHIHLIVQDVQATKQLWSKLLGTAPARIASLDGVSMPGMYVWFQQAAPSAAMNGSTIRDLGLRVRDLHAVLERAHRPNYTAAALPALRPMSWRLEA